LNLSVTGGVLLGVSELLHIVIYKECAKMMLKTLVTQTSGPGKVLN